MGRDGLVFVEINTNSAQPELWLWLNLVIYPHKNLDNSYQKFFQKICKDFRFNDVDFNLDQKGTFRLICIFHLGNYIDHETFF